MVKSPPRKWAVDLLAGGWFLLVALLLLTPALVHGPFLGPYNLLGQSGLLHHGSVTVSARQGDSDLIDEMIPWSNLVWTQVHQGHLPLWDPSNGLGMPLAFNWQSAPLGLPALIGYAFPVGSSFTVGVIVTFLIAGTGTFAFRGPLDCPSSPA